MATAAGHLFGYRVPGICTYKHKHAQSFSAEHKVVLTSHDIGGVGGWNVDLAYYPSKPAAHGEAAPLQSRTTRYTGKPYSTEVASDGHDVELM